MAIDIRGVSVGTALRTRITRTLGEVLARLPVEPTTTLVTFSDEDGPKGGVAIRCAVTLRVPRRPDVHVEDTAQTSRQAFDQTLATLDRQLARQRERIRDSKRHPKKYFAAKQLLAPAEKAAPPAPPRRRGSTR